MESRPLDDAAFEALFRDLVPRLTDFAVRYLGARDAAEETVQEVFLHRGGLRVRHLLPSSHDLGGHHGCDIDGRTGRWDIRCDRECGASPRRSHEMPITGVITQLRTTDLAGSIRFYTTRLGLTLEFQYRDFYAGIRAGNQVFHLKLVDDPDPSIDYVEEGRHFHLYLPTDDAEATAAAFRANGVTLLRDVHETAWRSKEFIFKDDQGHTIYVGQDLEA